MPTELEDLVEFLHHGNTQIRQIACENLVGYSTVNISLFKRHQLVPIKDLKLLVRDYSPISKNAITILINLSHDSEILQNLATDEVFIETLLRKITDPKDATADSIAMLLANLIKHPPLIPHLMNLTRTTPKPISTSSHAIDQLMDLFVRSPTSQLNPHATFDYLSYIFADLSNTPDGRSYLLTPQPYDDILPITKLTVFTQHPSLVRRRGVASTIKNVCFEISAHPKLLPIQQPSSPTADGEDSTNNILPYILLPLLGPEEFSVRDDETLDSLLPDLQLLPPDKTREPNPEIMITHLETLVLLTTTRAARDYMREVQVYPVLRECHLHVDHEGVREAVERVVQVLMRDESDQDQDLSGKEVGVGGTRENGVEVDEDEDEDRRVEEIF